MNRRHLWGLGPLVLYLGAFTLGPVVSTLLLGFRDSQGSWGLGAFRTIAAHYQFNDAVVNTLAITGLGLSLELCLGLVAAVILAGRLPAQGLVRALLLIPLGVQTIVSASAMRYVFGTVGDRKSVV